MDDSSLRRAAANHNRTQRPSPLAARPDRVAFWAVAMAVVAMVAAAASAHAGSGGIGINGASAGDERDGGGRCAGKQFGKRTLRLGDCGEDVRTLNWILKSKDYRGVALAEKFENSTAAAVRAFERNAGIHADGVVEDQTQAAIVRSMPSQVATWYGPTMWGNGTACGQTLTRRTVGVAHKTLPCGSKVVLRYRGRYLRTRVIDRGPYAHRAQWDLTKAAARRLGFSSVGIDEIRVAKLAKR